MSKILFLFLALTASANEISDYYREPMVASVVAKASECAEEGVQLQRVRVRAESAIPEDLFGFCPEKCGSHGCTYHIFEKVKGAPGLYREAGVFSGVYEIQKEEHFGRFNIKVVERLPGEQKRSDTLRFDGEKYP